jgi:hypothetical protein
MKIDEKLMALQVLGKLLEAHRTVVNTDLDGTVKSPPYPASILDSSDRLRVQAKIVELVQSIRADNAEDILTAKDYDKLLVKEYKESTKTNGSIPV